MHTKLEAVQVNLSQCTRLKMRPLHKLQTTFMSAAKINGKKEIEHIWASCPQLTIKGRLILKQTKLLHFFKVTISLLRIPFRQCGNMFGIFDNFLLLKIYKWQAPFMLILISNGMWCCSSMYHYRKKECVCFNFLMIVNLIQQLRLYMSN